MPGVTSGSNYTPGSTLADLQASMANDQNLLSGNGSNTGYVNPNDPYVYLGEHDIYDNRPGLSDFGSKSTRIDQATVSQMFQNLDHMSVAEQHKLYAQLLIAGYNSGSTVPLNKIAGLVRDSAFQDLYSSYALFLKDLSDRYSTAHQKISPDELLKQRIGYRFDSMGIKWNGNINKLDLNMLSKLVEDTSLAGTKTATSVSRDFMNPMDAKALVRGTLQQELGRDPTDAEFQDFLASVHQAEAMNPTRTTQTTTTDAQGGLVSQNSSTQRGINNAGVGEMVLEKAQQQPSWAEWSAMGTYAPAFYAALGSTVPGT